MDAARWSSYLSQAVGRPVAVRFGRARVTVLQSRRQKDGTLLLRMSLFLADPPQEVRESIAAWLRPGRRTRAALAPLRRWIDEDLPRLTGNKPRKHRLRSRGHVHDLEAIASSLWATHFPDAFAGREKPGLTWGRPQSRSARRARSLRLGSYNERDHLVRIHPGLDRELVPDWFVRYVIFHELLHAQIGMQRHGNRRIVHGPEFRRRERLYDDYARAIAWEKANLSRLLSARA